MKNKSLLLLVLVSLLCWLPPLSAASDQKKAITPMLSLLLLGQSETLQFIAYHRYVDSYRDLYVVKEDGTDRTALATSPNEDEIYADIYKSNRIIFMRGVSWLDKMGIYSINPDGKDYKKIIDSADYEGYWSTASNGRIIFLRWDGNAGACADYDLYSINPNGTGLVTLYNSPENDHFYASTNDNRIIFGHRRSGCGNNNLYSIKADGTGLVTIGASADGYYFDTLTTNNRVIFSRLKDGNNTDIYSIKTDGSDLSTIASSPMHEYYRAITQDNRIIFTKYDSTSNRSYLYIADVDGGNLQNLIASGVEGSIKSVNTVTSAGEIVFTSSNQSTVENLWVINIDGTGFKQLYFVVGSIIYCGITRENRIIFEKLDNNINPPLYDITSILLNGSGEKTLANSPDWETCESITPDGRLIFSRYAGGSNWDLFSIKTDGTNVATIADTSDDEYFMGVTSSSRIIFSQRGNSWGQPNYPDDNVDLYSIRSDGTGLTRIAGSNDSESFAAIF